MEDLNLHFTGDLHAITSANNLLSAFIDAHLFHGNELGIDQSTIGWRRCMDMNDRNLRNIVTGLGGKTSGIPRESGFDITAASEVMAILCLAESPSDLQARLDRILVGYDRAGKPVLAGAMGVTGSLAAILNEAIQPNLVQSREGTPAFVHGGPFANIAHGCNSVLATRMALAHADYAITEAGFAFDLGGEKFFDLKCRSAGLNPAAIVIVATVRALKMHGGVSLEELTTPDPGAVSRGLENLAAHLEAASHFGKPTLVAINRRREDTEDELGVIHEFLRSRNVPGATADVFGQGGAGAVELAERVVAATSGPETPYSPLYPLEMPLEKKIETIVTQIYGGDGVRIGPAAAATRARWQRLG
jgi:formate--tetrahydrofolate ligase